MSVCFTPNKHATLHPTYPELQPNEAKLLQFVGLVESVISEITGLREDTADPSQLGEVLGLEERVVKTILPVKARLQEKWLQQRAKGTAGGQGGLQTSPTQLQSQHGWLSPAQPLASPRTYMVSPSVTKKPSPHSHRKE
ncbi:hypothetical protein EON64_04455, partial [archaeon]